MIQKITVSREFMKDFDTYCMLHKFDKQEKEDLRNAIRENFSQTGEYIRKHMAVYNWMIEIWGYKPHYEFLIGYLASHHLFLDDDKKYGIDILAGFCYDVAQSEIPIQNSDAMT